MRTLLQKAGALLLLLLAPLPVLGSGLPTIRTGELQGLLAKDKGAVFLLDVRTPGEFANGRIPGSRLIPINQITGRLNEIPRDRQVIVVCATGARSGAVVDYLVKQGYKNVVNYQDGVFGWSRGGLPIER